MRKGASPCNEPAGCVGRSPGLGKSKQCGPCRLCPTSGTPISQDQSPMAMTLSKRRRIRGMEAAAGGGEGTPDVEEMYRLTDRLCRTPNDAYEAALDTIPRALGCSRAA